MKFIRKAVARVRAAVDNVTGITAMREYLAEVEANRISVQVAELAYVAGVSLGGKDWSADDVLHCLDRTREDLEPTGSGTDRDGLLITDRGSKLVGFLPANLAPKNLMARPVDNSRCKRGDGAGVIVWRKNQHIAFVPASWLNDSYDTEPER